MKNSITAITILFSSLYYPNVAAEPVPNTNLDVHLESSSIIGTGRSINIHRLPIIDTLTGTTTYYDASFEFGVDVNGELVFERKSSIAATPPSSVENFIAGTYESSDKTQYVLDGPSLLSDGRTGWVLTSEKYNASWITGTAQGHPTIGNLTIVDKLSGNISYGLQGNNSWGSDLWKSARIIGTQQIGKSIIISSFHNSEYYDNNDYSTARDTFMLTLVEIQ